MSRRNSQLIAAAVAATLGLTAVQGFAQENFTWNGGNGAKAWEASSNWTGGSGFVSQYPGDQAVDSANLNVALLGDLTTSITAKSIVLDNLTLGASDGAFATTIAGGSGLTLSANTIATVGAPGASNNIGIDLLLKGNLMIASGGTNALTLNGDLINAAPSGTRDVRNDSGQTLTINGDVILSDTVGSTGQIRFRNDDTATQTIINGVISNGAQSGGKVNYASGTFHIKSANTYTGITQLGENSPNKAATHVIYTDTPFGTGEVRPTGGSAIKTIEGASGLGTRTLANDFLLGRDLRFAGDESIVLNGKIAQSNSRSIINDLGAGKTLTVNGDVYAANSNDSRPFVFNGTGTTVLNGVMHDVDGAYAVHGTLKKDGTGRMIVTNAAAGAYTGDTIVGDGTLQLGTGAAPVNIPATILRGEVASATLELNHSGAQTIGAVVNGQLTINNVGTGVTTLNGTSFSKGGTINVNSGKMLINGQDVAALDVSNARKINGSTVEVDNVTGMQIGQTVIATGSGDMTINGWVTAINPAGPGKWQVIMSGGGSVGGTSGSATNDIRFEAGTGTGTSNVIVSSAGIVGGNGTIGGLLGVNGTVAPGASIGTLTVHGNSIINGTFQAEYDATGSGTSDLLSVGGALTLNGTSVLDLQALGGPADDAAYVLANYGSLSGTFGSILNLPSGYTIDYAFNDGASSNNIALVVVPEPASLGLLTLVTAAGLLRRRRRMA